MSAVAEIFVALALIFGAGDFALKKIHDQVRFLAVRKIEHGLPSLEAYTQRMTGKRFQWDERGRKSGHVTKINIYKNF
jgi:hypothetical protein